MAKCIHCKKGVQYGHHVSHAKNRVKRIFKPNIQKYKVKVNGEKKRVKLCTKCIKRLKKDGRLGSYERIYFGQKQKPIYKEEEIVAEGKKPKKREEEKRSGEKEEKLKIEEIVGEK